MNAYQLNIGINKHRDQLNWLFYFTNCKSKNSAAVITTDFSRFWQDISKTLDT